MKNAEEGIQKIQITLIGCIALFIFFKSMGIPFMGPLLVVSLGTFSLMSFGLMFYVVATNQNKGKSVLSLFLLNFACPFALISILFGVMLWPGLQGMVIIAAAIYLGGAISTFVIYKIAQDEDKAIFWRLIRFDLLKTSVLVLFAVFLLVIGFDRRIDIFSANPTKLRERMKQNEKEGINQPSGHQNYRY